MVGPGCLLNDPPDLGSPPSDKAGGGLEPSGGQSPDELKSCSPAYAG